MMNTATDFRTLFQNADYMKEKHVPVIEAPDMVKKGEMFEVRAMVGKEITHPNTTQHHIQWLAFYFQPQNSKYPYEIGKCDFSAHGSSVEGADTSTVYTHHEVCMKFKTDIPGTLFAASSCNIHGLWESQPKEIAIG